MPAFVIEYNRRTGTSQVSQFDDPADAMRMRFELMRVRGDDETEIVSITAPSLAAVKRSHSRYFHSEGVSIPA